MKKEKTVEDEQEIQEKEVKKKKRPFPVNLIVAAILFLSLAGGILFVRQAGLLAKVFDGGEERLEKLTHPDSKQDMGPIYPMETFIVNLLGNRGKSYLKARIELELSDEKLTAEINKRLPQLRDSVLTMLCSKSDDDVKTLEGKFQLRAEIISTLNRFLITGKIRNVYFTDFIVQ